MMLKILWNKEINKNIIYLTFLFSYPNKIF